MAVSPMYMLMLQACPAGSLCWAQAGNRICSCCDQALPALLQPTPTRSRTASTTPQKASTKTSMWCLSWAVRRCRRPASPLGRATAGALTAGSCPTGTAPVS